MDQKIKNFKVGDKVFSFYGDTFNLYIIKQIEENGIFVDVNKVQTKWIPYHSEGNPNYKINPEYDSLSKSINEAWHFINKDIDHRINKLKGLKGRLKYYKRQYMLENNMIPEHEKTWKELGYKSKEAYQEHMNDLYDDIRHGYIG